ncbi:hypothetical protein [Pelobacter seleniigenes]|uniref:hypothetical protein n=1 Tax=Pelobacter seleniigenes TaxID=407188 RepID=UPI0012B7BDDA|nr:hypothetical protein [Pelobacter seleniigenes]
MGILKGKQQAFFFLYWLSGGKNITLSAAFERYCEIFFYLCEVIADEYQVISVWA